MTNEQKLLEALKEARELRRALCYHSDAEDEGGDPDKWDKYCSRWGAIIAEVEASHKRTDLWDGHGNDSMRHMEGADILGGETDRSTGSSNPAPMHGQSKTGLTESHSDAPPTSQKGEVVQITPEHEACAIEAAKEIESLRQQVTEQAEQLRVAKLALDEGQDLVSKAMRKAYQLGQTYWQQADSESWSQNKKADETQLKFDLLVDETREALAKLGEVEA